MNIENVFKDIKFYNGKLWYKANKEEVKEYLFHKQIYIIDISHNQILTLKSFLDANDMSPNVLVPHLRSSYDMIEITENICNLLDTLRYKVYIEVKLC